MQNIIHYGFVKQNNYNAGKQQISRNLTTVMNQEKDKVVKQRKIKKNQNEPDWHGFFFPPKCEVKQPKRPSFGNNKSDQKMIIYLFWILSGNPCKKIYNSVIVICTNH